MLLGERGRIDDARVHFAEAVRLKPGFEEARLNLAVALARTGRLREALAEFRAVLQINPANTVARQAVAELDR